MLPIWLLLFSFFWGRYFYFIFASCFLRAPGQRSHRGRRHPGTLPRPADHPRVMCPHRMVQSYEEHMLRHPNAQPITRAAVADAQKEKKRFGGDLRFVLRGEKA